MTDAGARLHLGCGEVVIPGWINIDVKPFPGVTVIDLRGGIPFESVAYIFAEHFIEHLELTDAMSLLRECRRALADDGVLRLTTPNLDWVWAMTYATRWKALTSGNNRALIDADEWRHDASAARDCLAINRGFRGWGHRFLYNKAMLTEVLRRTGFAHVEWQRYGQSAHDALQALERHEIYPDIDAVPSLLVAEAYGRAEEKQNVTVEDLFLEYVRDVNVV